MSRGEPGREVCKRAWAIFDRMNGSSRKQMLLACEAEGLNPYTCATQFQKWKHRDDVKKSSESNNAAKQA